MKKIVLTSSVAFLTFASFLVYADGAYENPGLSAYLAQKPELPVPPKFDFPFPEGVYVSGTAGTGQIKSLRVVNSANQELTNLSNRKSVTQGGVSIGYLFKEAGWFNQVDIQYIGRNNVNYVGYNPQTGNILNATIKSQTGMAKLYSTLNIGSSIFPYVYAGAGVYHNRAPATLTFPNGTSLELSNATVFNPQQTIVDTSTTTNTSSLVNDFGQTVVINNTSNVFTTGYEKPKNSRQGAAGCAGLGVRFRFSRQIMVDFNYEYTYIGKVRSWNVFSPNSSFPVLTLNGDKMSAQAVNLTFIFQPWGYLTNPD